MPVPPRPIFLLALILGYGATAEDLPRAAGPAKYRDIYEMAARATAGEIAAGLPANFQIPNQNGATALMFAARYNSDPEVVRQLLKLGLKAETCDQEGDAALMYAARGNPNPEVLKRLLEASGQGVPGVNAKNRSGMTPLMHAAMGNPSLEMLRLLVDRGAEVNAVANNGMTPLMLAARHNAPEAAAILVAAGAKVDAKDNNGRTPLMHAAEANQDPAMVGQLLEAEADPGDKDRNGWTALMLAAMSNPSPEVARKLIQGGAEVNEGNHDKVTALHGAVLLNPNPEVASVLLDAGADPVLRDAEGKTALELAAANPGLAGNPVLRKLREKAGARGVTPAELRAMVRDADVDGLVKLLDQDAVDLRVKDDLGRGLLTEAAMKAARPGMVGLLVENGLDVNERDKSGWTPLMYAAAQNPNPAIVEELCKCKADVKMADSYRKTPLMLAARANENPAVLLALVQNGAEVNVKDADALTAMHIAARGNPNPKVLETLSKLGAHVNAKDGQGRTPIMYAASSNPSPEVLETLLRLGADPTIADASGKRAADYLKGNRMLVGSAVAKRLQGVFDAEASASLWKALETASASDLEKLLVKGANPNERNADDETPLMVVAGTNSDPEVLQLLIDSGANVDAFDKHGDTALMRAAARTANPETVLVLLRAAADAGIKNQGGMTAVDFARANPKLAGSPALKRLEQYARAAADAQIKDSSDVLEVAAKGKADLVRKYLKDGMNPDARDRLDRTPLMMAAAYNPDPAVVALLLEAGANPFLKDKEGRQAFDYGTGNARLRGTAPYWKLVPPDRKVVGMSLFEAAASGTPQQLETLLDRRPNLHVEDDAGMNALMWAAMKNPDPDVVAILVRAGIDVNRINKEGSTALMYAAAQNPNPDVVGTLLNSGADPTATDRNGKTARDYGQNNKALRSSAIWERLTTQDKDIFAIAIYGTPEQMREALKRGDDANGRDDHGATPLMRAAGATQFPGILTLLAEAGAKVNATRGKDGMTPLMFAAAFNDEPRITETLIKLGADVNAQDDEGLTPLMWAILKNPEPEVVRRLFRQNVDTEIRNRRGKTALSLAEQNPYLQGSIVYRELLAARKNGTEAAAKKKEDPFSIAATGTPDQMKAILNVRATVADRDGDGNTLLMAAARANPSPEVVKQLLAAGADLNTYNNQGQTPLMLAAGYNASPEVVLALLAAGADDTLQDKAGQQAIAYADQNPNMKETPAYKQLLDRRIKRSLDQLLRK